MSACALLIGDVVVGRVVEAGSGSERMSSSAVSEDRAPTTVIRIPDTPPSANTFFGSTVLLDKGFLYISAPGGGPNQWGKLYKSMWIGSWTTPEAEYLESIGANAGRAIAARNGDYVVSGRDRQSALFGGLPGRADFYGGPSKDFSYLKLIGESSFHGNNNSATVAMSDKYFALASMPVLKAGWVVMHDSSGAQMMSAGGTDTPRIVEPVSDDFSGFGTSMAMDDDMLVVGAPTKLDSKGSVYVFVRSGGTWTFTQRIDGEGAFGRSLALVGSTLVVGEPEHDGFRGRVHVYSFENGSFGNDTVLTPADSTGTDLFGYSVAMSPDGNSIAVGAPQRDSRGVANSGAAYLYVRDGAQWTAQTTMSVEDGSVNAKLGSSVTVEGSVVVAGAPNTSSESGSVENSGLVAVFGSPSESKKVPVASVTAPASAEAGEEFEFAIKVEGTVTAFAGTLNLYSQSGVTTFHVDKVTGKVSGTWPSAGNASFIGYAVNANGWSTTYSSVTVMEASTGPSTTVPTSSPTSTTAPTNPTTTSSVPVSPPPNTTTTTPTTSTPTTTSPAGSGGGGTTVRFLTTKNSRTPREVAKYTKKSVSTKATLTLTVSSSSRKVCKYSGGRLRGLTVGRCRVVLESRTKVGKKTVVRRYTVSVSVQKPS